MRLKIIPIIIIIFINIIIVIFTKLTFAQTCLTQTTNPKAEGLISSPNAPLGVGNPTGTCATGGDAIFIPFKIPSYQDLYSIFYTQAKDNPGALVNKNTAALTAPYDQVDIPMGTSEDQLYAVAGNMTLSGNPTGTRSGIVFVNGNLDISANYTFSSSSPNFGTVFIVSGDINIASSVTQINAVLISGGKIYTAGANCITNSVGPGGVSQLVINGSLVSINSDTSTANIKFCRTISDNSLPAEKINQQPKYLVILRNIFTQTLQSWREIAASEINPAVPDPDKPSPPTSVVATAGNGQATVSWNAPSDNGGSPIISYTINTYLANGSASGIAPSSFFCPCITLSTNITGLTNNTAYKFKVLATNSIGSSSQSSSSNQITPVAPKRVFITSTTYNGNLGGVAGADAKCQTQANVASLGGTWKAWISPASRVNSATLRLTHATIPYVLLNNTIIANNWTDLTDGALAAYINITENNTLVPASPEQVWTNTRTDGTAAINVSTTNTCGSDWKIQTSNQGYFGYHSLFSGGVWTLGNVVGCGTLAHLYCFEQ